jgi:hypothetical protein
MTAEQARLAPLSEVIEVDGVRVEKLTRKDRAMLGYEVDLTHEEVAQFEEAVTAKMVRVGYERITRPELFLKVQEALAAFKKEQAVRAAVGAFHRMNPTSQGAQEIESGSAT